MTASLVLLAALASPPPVPPAPLAGPVRPVYPEGSAVPRGLTDAERQWLAAHPVGARRAATPPPLGPVRCPAEYEPMQGILVAWEGQQSWRAILTQIGR